MRIEKIKENLNYITIETAIEERICDELFETVLQKLCFEEF